MKYLLTQFRLKRAAWVFLFLFLPFLGFPLFFRPNGYLSPVQVVSINKGDVYPLDWRVVETAGAMSEKAADRAELVISQKQSAGKKTVLLLPTGDTPKGMYRSLVRRTKEGLIHWKDVTIFMLDEYAGGDDYDRYIHKNFMDQLPEDNRPAVFVLNGKAENLEAECGDYERRINKAGGVDLAVLGIGVEGHIGFNEKGSDLETRTRVIPLAESTIRVNPEVAEKGYTHAVTVGVATILSSREIILLANKPTKAAILERLWSEVPHADNPATWLKTHPKVTVLLDIQAAVRLPVASLGLSDIMSRMLYSEIARQFNAPVGGRGIFEELFKDKDPKTGQPLERGGWVHRPWEILKSDLPEEIEKRVKELKAQGVTTIGFIAMGGESSIISPSTGDVLNVSNTSPRKIWRLIGARNLEELKGRLEKIRWWVISKSSTTTETNENANYLIELYESVKLDPAKYITFVTDPGTEWETSNDEKKNRKKQGFRVEYRELNDQTTIGGRNTLVNNPTLLACAWQYPGRLRPMLEALTKAHPQSDPQDPWIRAAVETLTYLKQGRPKLAVILPEKLRKRLWIWIQQNPEESLGKDGKGFTVYTSRRDLERLRRLGEKGWIFVELRLAGQESETKTYAEAVQRQGHPVVTIPVPKTEENFPPQVISYGWMKFVAIIGGLWGVNFSDQPPVEAYKSFIRSIKEEKGRLPQISDAIENAQGAVVEDAQFTLIYDGLLSELTDEQKIAIEEMKSNGAPPAAIYAKLLRFTREELDAQTLAYYDDVDEVTEETLESVTEGVIDGELGYAAKWGEGTGVLHGLYVSWYSGPKHQIPVQILAKNHEQPGPPFYVDGPNIQKGGAVAAHVTLVKEKRPSVMLVIHGQLDGHGVRRFFEKVLEYYKNAVPLDKAFDENI